MKFVALLALVLLACGDDSSSSGATSLEGSIECGTPTTQCTTGQVCLHFTSGIDAGPTPGDSYECKAVPGSCPIVDCGNNPCASCINNLCSPTTAYSVSGRTVNCLGQ